MTLKVGIDVGGTFTDLMVFDSENKKSFAVKVNSNPKNPLMAHWKKKERVPQPYEHILVDYRHLFGLLNRIYHWDNAEIGSHLVSRRRPKNAYNKLAGNFLNFLYIARN